MKLLHNHLLIETIPETEKEIKTDSGIIMLATQRHFTFGEHEQKCKIIALSDNMANMLSVGQIIYVSSFAGLHWEKNQYVIMYPDIWAVEVNGEMMPFNNKVKIKLLRNSDEFICKDGTVLKIPTEFSVWETAPVIAEVIALPKELNFSIKPMHGYMDWETDIEAKVGDVVWVEQDDIISSLSRNHNKLANISDSKFIKEGETIFAFVSYQSLIATKRGDDIIPFNGRILLEAEDESYHNKTIVIPDTAVKKSKTYGRILAIGKPLKRYATMDEIEIDIAVGDRVKIGSSWSIVMECKLFAMFPDKTIYVIQRRAIDCVIEDVQ